MPCYSLDIEEVVYIGSCEFVVDVVDGNAREALLKRKEADGTWSIRGWFSWDELSKVKGKEL